MESNPRRVAGSPENNSQTEPQVSVRELLDQIKELQAQVKELQEQNIEKDKTIERLRKERGVGETAVELTNNDGKPSLWQRFKNAIRGDSYIGSNDVNNNATPADFMDGDSGDSDVANDPIQSIIGKKQDKDKATDADTQAKPDKADAFDQVVYDDDADKPSLADRFKQYFAKRKAEREARRTDKEAADDADTQVIDGDNEEKKPFWTRNKKIGAIVLAAAAALSAWGIGGAMKGNADNADLSSQLKSADSISSTASGVSESDAKGRMDVYDKAIADAQAKLNNPNGAAWTPFDSINQPNKEQAKKTLSADTVKRTKDTLQSKIDQQVAQAKIDADVDSAKQKLDSYNNLSDDEKKQKESDLQDVANAVEGANKANADSQSQSKADTQKSIDELKKNLSDSQDKLAASKMGVSVEDYRNYGKTAEATGLSVDKVKELANFYGIPADKVGNPAEAQQYMRDQLQANSNVSEKFNSDATAEDVKDNLLFTAKNNYGTLAMYAGAMEDNAQAGNDAGLDGFKTPQIVVDKYKTYLSNPDQANQDFAKFKEALDNGTITLNGFYSNRVLSYGLIDNNLVVGDSAVNSGHLVTLADGTKFGVSDWCSQILVGLPEPEPVYTTYTVVTRTPNKTYTPPTTTPPTYNPPVTPPSNPPETPPSNPPENPPKNPPLTPKDPTANDKQQNDADNFEDKAPATDKPQEYVPVNPGTNNNNNKPVDQPSQEQIQQDAGNTDKNPNNGSEYIPKPDNDNGDISGVQPDKPNWQGWSDPGQGAANNNQQGSNATGEGQNKGTTTSGK